MAGPGLFTRLLIVRGITIIMIQKGGKRLGPTCGAGTAKEKKAGVGLLLNGAYLSNNRTRRSWIWYRTYIPWRHVALCMLASRCVTLAASPGVTWRYVGVTWRHMASPGITWSYVGQKCNQPCLLGCAASRYL